MSRSRRVERHLASELWRGIVSGRWPVDTQIPTMTQFARQFGLAVPTVREAVGSLGLLGMVETLGGRGTFVRAASPAPFLFTEYVESGRVAEVLTFRRALEVEAARRAAEVATPSDLELLAAACSPAQAGGHPERGPGVRPRERFHDLLVETARSRLLAEWHRGTTLGLRHAPTRAGDASAQQPETQRTEHLRIVEAISAADPDAAATAAAAHTACSPAPTA